MELPPTLDLLKSNDIFACNTATMNHFVKRTEGAHNFWATKIVLQGIMGEAVKTMELVDELKITHMSYSSN